MPELPLLIFPSKEITDRIKIKRNIQSGTSYPNIERQTERLSPVFENLQNVFNQRRVEIQREINGIDPEQVLVFETIDSVADFAKAVQKIEGLEWLGEFEEDEIDQDEDFYMEENPEKLLDRRLFITMSNQRALRELLSLWETYTEDPTVKLRKGLAKFKDVFSQLRDIRKWDVNDRLLDTGILENWRFQIENNKENIPFEIELWHRLSELKRRESERYISSLIREIGGRVLSSSIISEITYHAILAELPSEQIRIILEAPNTKLLKCDSVMFFRPVGQIADIKSTELEDVTEVPNEAQSSLPTSAPILALLDGLPMANHNLLTNKLIIDDPDNFEDLYPAEKRIHGTAMSSIITNGDLNDSESPLTTPLYVRPIMKYSHSNDVEQVPEDVLFVDLLHRSVKRIAEGEGDFPALNTIKVINLSIGDPTRMFYHSLSPAAKLLDWLSYKYKVLFIISAGNHPYDIYFEESYRDLIASGIDIKNKIIEKVLSEQRNRRILSPSESINNITVGALNFDNSTLRPVDSRINPSVMLFPSTITSFGNGYRRSIKPDLVYYGGRQVYEEPLVRTNPAHFRISRKIIEPGNKVAAPNNLNTTVFTRGTSNSAAFITRYSALILNTIDNVFNQQNITIGSKNIVPMIKSMLVHGCKWEDIESNIKNVLGNQYNNKEYKNIITRWIGYGLPEISKVIACTEQRVTILGYGEISQDKVHVFNLPLPPSLSARNDKRKLTITLAWLSPVATNTQRYRTASLFFDAEFAKINTVRDDADYNAVKRGTVQHEIFVGEQAAAFEDGDSINISIVCKKDAIDFTESIPYAITVTLEVAEGIDIDIYQEVRSRIIIPVAVPVR